MNAIILSVGDELVSGLTVNTNEAWLAQQLTALGIPVSWQTTVPDAAAAIADALRRAAAEADLILVSGGLGPTADDVTRDAVAAALGEPLVEDAGARAAIEEFFRSRQRTLTPSNLLQCRRPRSAACLPNSCGTAPGLAARLGDARVFVTPGVPREMHEMFRRSILPQLQSAAGERVTLTWKIHTFGRGESMLGEQIQDLMARGGTDGLTVGTTVADGIVSVRIYATGPRNVARDMLERTRQTLLTRLGPLVFGENEQTIPEAVSALLRERGQTIATAESCTGGTIAQMLTDVPGSSAYFLRGWVTYSNESKTAELGVPADLIASHGAVSESVARAMARGARAAAETDWAIATTGIAGPDGGSPEKPVGTVWLAIAGPDARDDTLAYRYFFPGTRLQVRQRSSQMVLTLLRWKLLGLDPLALLK